MGGHDEVCLLGDVESLAQGVSAAFEVDGFVHEEVGGEDDSSADDVDFVALEDAGGDGAEDVFLSFELEGVSCVGASLEACDDVVVGGEHIDYFSFSFVAPLEAEEYINFVCHEGCLFIRFYGCSLLFSWLALARVSSVGV